MRSTLLAWLRFLRLPNVLTVPGDVVAGAVLSGRPPAADLFAIVAVCLAYLFGMALNDCVDLPEDRRERPDRPLPAGLIPLAAAWTACILLAASAYVAQPGWPMGLLLGMVLTYTLLKRPVPFLAPPLMGVCRGLAVWIGAGAPLAWSPMLGLWMGVWTLYIGLVTRLAALETRGPARSRLPVVLVCLVTVALAVGWGTAEGTGRWASLPPALLLLAGGFQLYRRIQHEGAVRPSHIGGYIALLFPLQAFVVALADHPLAAALILCGLPLSRLARRWIPAS